MNYFFRALPLLVVFFLFAFMSSCQKSGNCPDAKSLTILHNGPVIEGWPLQLEADYQTTAYLYKWSGPNGWKQEYETYASDAYMQERVNITVADAGEYKLQLVNAEGCVEYEGTTQVEVIPPPTPPCNISANSSVSSAAGVGDYSFNYRLFSASSGHFFVSCSEIAPGGDNMKFAFLGNDLPLPGTYLTSGYFGMEPGKVGLYIGTGTYDFVAHPGQTVFVNKVNNKIQISFCSLLFNNPLSPPNPITISAKIVQP
jgi:hypothetical protein